jgi:hypothetical protein
VRLASALVSLFPTPFFLDASTLLPLSLAILPPSPAMFAIRRLNKSNTSTAAKECSILWNETVRRCPTGAMSSCADSDDRMGHHSGVLLKRTRVACSQKAEEFMDRELKLNE